ncbi:autotransporter domain-containing protein [Mesorhizobium sp. VK9D]|uniref:autotransporter domain-containing protein n=1 Tax=Mesorhizobium australafricanum TaxID=3072311 RepID=UPI002A23A780|nr:autotransporter domain-containing protein [Mesorhizobium sp. VK9D]MDX8455575.1 autotransporter domain-containing protein [Mesorhizobium sp. VK9D]
MAALGLALATTTPSLAQEWTGAVSSDWSDAGNWAGGVPTSGVDAYVDRVTPNATVVGAAGAQADQLYVGYSGTGELTIRNGGAVSNIDGYLGLHADSTGTVTVDGVGSTWTNSGDLHVGRGGTGTLTIQNGGKVSNTGYIGTNGDSTGTATVDGDGSSWTNSGFLAVGWVGTGELTIRNGGAVSNDTGWIGAWAESTGTVTVDGSSWTNSDDLYVGTWGTGALTIQNGGAVSNINGYLGFHADSTGTATVDGGGSTWTNSGDLYVGDFGTGTLTIQNGGMVSASSMEIASRAGSTGTLNIGAASGQPAAAPGTLNTASVAFGAGTGRIVFNHTASNYIFAPTVSGAGSVTVEAGTTILTGNNSYTGGTTIAGGALQLGNGGTAGSITGDVTNDGILSFNRSDAVAFGGAISGRGRVNKDGAGTLTLDNANTYTGGTTINAGTLNIGHLGALGTGEVTLTGGGALNSTVSGSLTNGVNFAPGSFATVSASTGRTLTLGGRVNMGSGGGATVHFGSATNAGTVVLDPGGGVIHRASSIAIDGGTLRLGRYGSDYTQAAAGTSIASGATLDINGNASVNHLSGAGTVTNDSGAAATLTANYASASTFSGVIRDGTGSIALTKTGSGALTLSGANTYTGGTTINAGTLNIGDMGALGTGEVTLTGGGALNSTVSGVLTNAVTFATGSSATVSASTGRTLTLDGLVQMGGLGGGATVHFGSATNTGTVVLDPSAGVISGASSIAIDGGTLRFAEIGSFFTRNAAGTSIASGATLDINGDAAVNRLSGAGTVTNDSGAAATLTANYNSASTFSGVIRDGTGSIALTKTGSGALTLSGANTYTGATTIGFGGTLQIGDGGTSGSISGSSRVGISGGATLSLNRRDDVTFANVVVTGAAGGQFNLDGSGMTSLTGSNSVGNQFLGTANVNAGTLRVDGRFGDTVGNAATVIVNSGGTLSGTGTIAGTVTVNSGGTLAAGHSPGTLTMGSLTLTAGSISNFELNAPGVVGGASNDLVKVTGNLRLDGTLNVQGAPVAGYYRLFNYGGALAGSFGTVNAAGFSNADVQTTIPNQVNLALLNAGQYMQFWDGADATGNGTIDGGGGTWSTAGTNWTGQPGQAEINGSWIGSVGVFAGAAGGAVAVAGVQSFDTLQFSTNGYGLNGGTLAFNPATGSAATIQVDNAVSVVIGSTLSDGATGNRLTKTGGGTLTLTGANTYTGGTTLSGGVLSVSSDSSLGAAAGALTFDGGTLQVTGTGFTSTTRTIDWGTNGGGFDIVDASNAFTLKQTLGAGGSLTKRGAGTLILTADNAYTGGTTISGGTLQLGDGGTSGSIVGNVVNNGTLAFNRGDTVTFGGGISGSGAVRQIGVGKTELAGDSSGFSGTTSVENGILAVNGKLGGTLDVRAGGRLQGIGTVGGTTVSGTIAPGNSIGTLNVAGNAAFNAGSIYEVEVDAAGQADRIDATGTATINGGTVTVLAGAGNYKPQTDYTILSAGGGVSGTFAGVTSNLAFLDPTLGYDAGNVYLRLRRNDITFHGIGLTLNQIATGAGTESLGWNNPVYDAVANLSADQARTAFDQLSGEIHASAKTALIEDSRFLRNAVNDRLRAAFEGVGAASAPVTGYADGEPVLVPATTDRFAVWSQGFGSWGHSDGDGNAARLNRSTGGVFIGADAPVFETWRFGAVAGYSRTTFNVRDRRSSGTSDNYHVGLYGGTQWGSLAFRTAAAYTWHDISTDRTVVFPGFSDSLKGDYNAGTAQVFGELGYGIRAGNFAFEPFANLAYVSLHADGFTERGGAAALTSAAANTEATFATLGLRASNSLTLGGIDATAKGTLGWRHAFGDVTPLSTMAFAGGAAFPIAGVPIARDAAVIEAGLDFALTPATMLGVSYNGQFASGVSDQSVRAVFNMKF